MVRLKQTSIINRPSDQVFAALLESEYNSKSPSDAIEEHNATDNSLTVYARQTVTGQQVETSIQLSFFPSMHWLVGDATIKIFSLVEPINGKSQITMTMELKCRRLLRLFESWFRPILINGMKDEFERIKTQLERA
jgi:hypothetical protein